MVLRRENLKKVSHGASIKLLKPGGKLQQLVADGDRKFNVFKEVGNQDQCCYISLACSSRCIALNKRDFQLIAQVAESDGGHAVGGGVIITTITRRRLRGLLVVIAHYAPLMPFALSCATDATFSGFAPSIAAAIVAPMDSAARCIGSASKWA